MGKQRRRQKPDIDAYTFMKKSKKWHHDIKQIDGRPVEVVVEEFQKTNIEEVRDDLLTKIIENYSIFRNGWANAFAQYMDNDVESGELMHDEVVWRAAKLFDMTRAKKVTGKAFNAYMVSSQLNSLKNLRNTKMSHKNHPRIQCPICGEKVFQIDEKHLTHEIDLDRYKKSYPNHPLISLDGMTKCPVTGDIVEEITESRINRIFSTEGHGYYTVEDFKQEYKDLIPTNIKCVMTGIIMSEVDNSYPSSLMAGYTESEFINDFPDFKGIFICPFSGEKKLEITQEHLDKVFNQAGRPRLEMSFFLDRYKFYTTKPRKMPVMNPYTGKMFPELTLGMLKEAGTNLKDHLSRYSTIQLNKRYDAGIRCPFTGRKSYMITPEDIEKTGHTVHEFFQVTCKYPLRKWQVKCAISGEWIENAWKHLVSGKHNYATPMTLERFKIEYGSSTKATISTNSYIESDSGDSMHICDMFIKKIHSHDALEIEDSLVKHAADELDNKIVKSIRKAHTLEDLFYMASDKQIVHLSTPFKMGMTKEVKQEVKDKLKASDFDISMIPKEGATEVTVLIPSREVIKRRLSRMIAISDLSG